MTDSKPLAIELGLTEYDKMFDLIPFETINKHFPGLEEYLEAQYSMLSILDTIYEPSTVKPFFLPYLKKNYKYLCQNAPDLICSIIKINYKISDDNYKINSNKYYLSGKDDTNKIINTAEKSYHEIHLKLVTHLNSPRIMRSALLDIIAFVESISNIQYYYRFRKLYYLLLNELRFSLILLSNVSDMSKACDFDFEFILQYDSLLNELSVFKIKDVYIIPFISPIINHLPNYSIINTIFEDLIIIYNRLERALSDPKYQDRISDSGSSTSKPEMDGKTVNILGHLKDLSWDKIHIIFTSNDSVRIKANNYVKEFHFSDLKMNDNRRYEKPDRNWVLLKKFAEENGTIHYDSILYEDNKKKLKKSTSNLRKKLKLLFGIEENPIENYKSQMGYKTKFDIKSEIPEQFYGSDQQKEKINELKGE